MRATEHRWPDETWRSRIVHTLLVITLLSTFSYRFFFLLSSQVGYSIIDLNAAASKEVKEKIAAMPANIRTRILY